MTITVFTEAEAIEHARQIMDELAPDYKAGDVAVKAFWIDWTNNKNKTAPKVDPETGEILPPKEYRCVDCDVELVRPDGHRGKMFIRCEECRENHVVVPPPPMLHFCERCETQLFRADGSATGKGKWSKLCQPCKDSQSDRD